MQPIALDLMIPRSPPGDDSKERLQLIAQVKQHGFEQTVQSLVKSFGDSSKIDDPVEARRQRNLSSILTEQEVIIYCAKKLYAVLDDPGLVTDRR